MSEFTVVVPRAFEVERKKLVRHYDVVSGEPRQITIPLGSRFINAVFYRDEVYGVPSQWMWRLYYEVFDLRPITEVSMTRRVFISVWSHEEVPHCCELRGTGVVWNHDHRGQRRNPSLAMFLYEYPAGTLLWQNGDRVQISPESVAGDTK